MRINLRVFAAALLAASLLPSPARAARRDRMHEINSLEEVWGLVWSGEDSLMTLADLAAYCAPILWFSPDEPLLGGTTGTGIRIPAAFPFEESAGTPVVYYRLRRLITTKAAKGGARPVVSGPAGAETVDISRLVAADLDFFFYYPREEGFGRHDHDVESVEMKMVFSGRERFVEGLFAMGVWKVIGKAHGVLWYDNTLMVDEDTRFPLVVLVEEGKHASCTDKNGDGYYTPGYDVNRRINDAWGVRDIIRSGGLRTGEFESWMVKVRDDSTAVFPPLPADSPHRGRYEKLGVYAPAHAKYELRPFPSSEKAADELKPFIDSKGPPGWPAVEESRDFKRVSDWLVEEEFMKSIGVAARYDGDLGIAFAFPLFIVKNFEEPMTGGWIVNRIYLKDHRLRDFGYNVMYTRSASRWIDGYFAVGFERDAYDVEGGIERNTSFVTETGIKFRANLAHSPFSFMTALGTEFWGMRLGIKYREAWEFDRIGYVVELGAGVW